MTEKERNLLYGVVSLILPDNILDQFDIVKLEDEDIDRHDGSYQPFKHNVHIYLEEQDNRTAEQRATGARGTRKNSKTKCIFFVKTL